MLAQRIYQTTQKWILNYPRILDTENLAAASPMIPILRRNLHGHMNICNTKALEEKKSISTPNFLNS